VLFANEYATGTSEALRKIRQDLAAHLAPDPMGSNHTSDGEVGIGTFGSEGFVRP
jgi:hypothetical protein